MNLLLDLLKDKTQKSRFVSNRNIPVFLKECRVFLSQMQCVDNYIKQPKSRTIVLLPSKYQRRTRSQGQILTLKFFFYNLECYFTFAPLTSWMEVLFPLLVRCFLFRCFVVFLSLRFWDWNFINIIDVRAGKMS